MDDLTRALAELDVPEHGATFWADLSARLRDEPVPLAPRRHWKRQTLRVVTVAAAVAVLAVALGVRLGDGPLAPRPATAAEVAEKVSDAFAAAGTLRGTLVVRELGAEGPRTTFVTTADGDLRLETRTSRGEVNVVAYDAERGVEESYWLPGPGGGFEAYGGVRTGLAPLNTPDQGPMDWVLRTDLTTTLRAASPEPAEETTYDGRPAWVLGADVTPQDSAGELAYDRIEATIDRETAFPVRIVESRDGLAIREITVEGLTAGTPAARAEFDLTVPHGVTVTRTDEGFRRVATPPDGALVPSAVPEGFVLAEVAVAERGSHTGVEGHNPESREVVSLLYRRGFDTLLVTTRLRTSGEWTDPMASGEGVPDEPEPVALAGMRAEYVANARGTAPHVWALTDTLVVTVSGDLTREELIDVAESLA